MHGWCVRSGRRRGVGRGSGSHGSESCDSWMRGIAAAVGWFFPGLEGEIDGGVMELRRGIL